MKVHEIITWLQGLDSDELEISAAVTSEGQHGFEVLTDEEADARAASTRSGHLLGPVVLYVED